MNGGNHMTSWLTSYPFSPAGVLRSRFDPGTVERLRALTWWDWDAEKVTRNVRLICAGDVEALERGT